MTENELKKRISYYVQGSLNSEETEEMWAGLMQYPELLSYLETEAGLRYLLSLGGNNRVEDPDRNKSGPFRWFGYLA